MQPSTPTAYASLGLSSPRKTFLDGRGNSQRPATSQKASISPSPPTATRGGAPQTAEAVLLVEHKVEITDMLQECLALLDNAYRSKQVFGDHLRYVDPSYAGDGVLKLQLNTPPPFDPSYGTSVAPAAESQSAPRSPPSHSQGDGDLQRKLRTAEELIKKLFKKNTQLEVENKYFRDELARMDRLVGLSRAPQHTIQVYDGHQPLDHPLFTAETRRRCRSCPPSRTLMRTAVNGFGLTFTSEDPSDDQQQSAEGANGLRKRIVQLTESLVAVQHENDLLVREKQSRVSHRDRLLNHYLVMRDKQLAQLRWSLQQAILKVNNPAKLFRARQPNPGTNPVVATNNILKEVSQRLVSEVASVADEIMIKSNAMVGGGELGGQLNVEMVGSQRRELVQRLRAITDTLPLAKKKQLLNLFSEVRQLFDSLVEAHRCLLYSYDSMRRDNTHDVVRLKLEVSLLKDQLRSGERQ